MVLAFSLCGSGCSPVSFEIPGTTRLDHVVMVMNFVCSEGTAGAVSITATQAVVSTSDASRVYTGAYPTYSADGPSISFVDGYGGFILAERGSQQACELTGLG